MIGNLDLFDIPEEGRWEIAYDLDPDYWGKGLGGMMVGSLVQWAGVIGVKLISTVCALSYTQCTTVSIAFDRLHYTGTLLSDLCSIVTHRRLYRVFLFSAILIGMR